VLVTDAYAVWRNSKEVIQNGWKGTGESQGGRFSPMDFDTVDGRNPGMYETL